MSAEPKFFAHVKEALTSGESKVFGVGENWVAPVANYFAPVGFAEESWLKAAPETTIAWILSGAEIDCRWGAKRGMKLAPAHRPMALHLRGAPNHYAAHGRISFAHFYLTDDLLHRILDDLGLPLRGGDVLRDDLIGFRDETLHRWLNEYLDRSGNRADVPSRVEMEARAILIVERLLRVHHLERPTKLKGGLPPRVLARVCDFMLSHLARDVSLAELAGLAQFSPFHFCRAFKESTGVSPHVWLTERRIERAKEIMANHPGIGLLEVALSVGYESQTAFGAAFRRLNGRSPGRWRRETRA